MNQTETMNNPIPEHNGWYWLEVKQPHPHPKGGYARGIVKLSEISAWRDIPESRLIEFPHGGGFFVQQCRADDFAELVESARWSERITPPEWWK